MTEIDMSHPTGEMRIPDVILSCIGACAVFAGLVWVLWFLFEHLKWSA